MSALQFLWSHRTKILGFFQITIGAMSLWTFIPPTVATYLTAANGLLTVWVGWFNSRQNEVIAIPPTTNP